jgi:hypothetical protein
MRSLRWFAAAAVLLLTVAVTPSALAAPRPRPPKAPLPPIQTREYALMETRLTVKAPRPPRGSTITGPTRADLDGDRVDDIVIGSQGAVFVDYSRNAYTDLIQLRNPDGSTGGFGQSLAVGDFNGDGLDDLAVGSPREEGRRIGSLVTEDAGAVWIIPGGVQGVRVDEAQRFTQETPGVPSVGTANERFGWKLATGDLSGDGRDDLAVYAVGEKDVVVRNGGAVTVLYGSADGVTASGSVQLNQALSAVPGLARPDNSFGFGLAIGDVTGDRYADLVVSAMNDTDGQLVWSDHHAGTGKLYLFKGSAAGVSLTGVQQVTAWAAGLPNGAAWPDPILQTLGMHVAIADLTGDGYGDVVATAPGSQVGPILAGAVLMLRGTPSGLTLSGRQVISENSPGVPGTARSDGGFGGTGLQVGDITGDGRPDVVLPNSPQAVGDLVSAGRILLLPGSTAGIGTSGARMFDQRNAADLCGPGVGEGFGANVSLLNLDGTGQLDALVTTSTEHTCGTENPVVTVFGGGPGTLAGYGTVSSDTYRPDLFFIIEITFGILP